MQIRYEKTGEIEHVSNEVGRFAIKTGLATEVIPVPTTVQAKKGPSTTWAAVRGQISGDYEEQPFIYHHCGTCGIAGSSTGRTAYITQKIWALRSSGRPATKRRGPVCRVLEHAREAEAQEQAIDGEFAFG